MALIVLHVPCSLDNGSEGGSYLRLIDFVSLNSRLESNKEEEGMQHWSHSVI